MDSKLDSIKDETSDVTENDASKAKTSKIKLFVGVIAVAVPHASAACRSCLPYLLHLVLHRQLPGR